MGKYSKLLGTIIGSAVGIGLVALGVAETDLPQYQTFIDLMITTVLGALGTYIAPPNATE